MERRIEPQAIRSLKILILVAVLLPLPLLAYAGWKSYGTILGVSAERTQRTVDVLQEHTLKVLQTIDRTIAETNEVLRDRSDEQIRADREFLHRRLQQSVKAVPEVEAIWVFDAQGRPLVTSAMAQPPPDLDNSDRDYFSAHSSGVATGTYIGEVIKARVGDLSFFVVSQRRPSEDGRFNGVVALTVPPASLNAFYARIASGTGMSANLVRADGSVLARYPAQNGAGRLGAGSAFAQAIATSDEGAYTTVSPIDQVERNVTYRKLPNYPLYVASGFERRVIWAELGSQLAGYLWFGVPAMLFLLFISCVALSRTRSFLAELQRRETAETALKQAQRLEAIGQMTGGIAHDFNNILLVVQGNAERLSRQIADPKQLRAVSAILQAAALGERLTRQLLTFARRQTVAPTDLDLTEQLPRLREILEASLRGDIALKLHFPPALWPVKVDPSELELALINLAVNARDAMPDGGEISVHAENVILGHAQAPDQLEGEFVALSVADTGTGIDPEIMPRIFDPFFTTKGVGKGTGLGLSQVYGFSRQAGGTATAASTPGKGATFTLYLPRGDAPPGKPPDLPSLPEDSPLHGTRLLLVEDNPSAAEITRANLEDLGCEVTFMPTADAALDRLARSDESFDVVLSDIMMPGATNGIDLARWLRKERGHMAVVLATGFSVAAQQAKDEGFFITSKPYELKTLESLLVQSMRRVSIQTAAEPPRHERGSGREDSA